MGVFDLFKKNKTIENTDLLELIKPVRNCSYCVHFINNSYRKLYEGACEIYDDFETCQVSGINNTYIDERKRYEKMLIEKAKGCPHFRLF